MKFSIFKKNLDNWQGTSLIFGIFDEGIESLLENIKFNSQYNLLKNQLKIIDITINDKTPDNIDNIEEILQTYNTQDILRITNWIDLKNFVNKIFDNYFG